ncbi:hypothetical protein LY90DRAFT_678176 [Neocallimastix californiae]|uniref:Uncharacterized protein n=1 Tax=Neocallimastix californiae TaxID=1754190 RepID=A0A1Y1ZFY6_9FUNG|nr:hypothetical protein LY90DRAFT_678176 [Neocallimastix californiae]|eukprot:ORY08755.1 hypothetical protein LY90DRAFT_678176 [Neocallimastix californiae]
MNDIVSFPPQWDKTNPYAMILYDKCKMHYKLNEEEKLYESFIPNAVFHAICISVLVYSYISLILVIIKRDAYIKTKSNVNLSIIFSVGTIMNVTSLYLKRVNLIIYLFNNYYHIFLLGIK